MERKPPIRDEVTFKQRYYVNISQPAPCKNKKIEASSCQPSKGRPRVCSWSSPASRTRLAGAGASPRGCPGTPGPAGTARSGAGGRASGPGCPGASPCPAAGTGGDCGARGAPGALPAPPRPRPGPLMAAGELREGGSRRGTAEPRLGTGSPCPAKDRPSFPRLPRPSGHRHGRTS